MRRTDGNLPTTMAVSSLGASLWAQIMQEIFMYYAIVPLRLIGRPAGVEPATAWTTTRNSTIELRPPLRIEALAIHDHVPHHNGVQENGNCDRATQDFLAHC